MRKQKSVAVVFNCQYRPIVNCLRAIGPRLSVDGYHLYNLPTDPDDFISSRLSDYSQVICQALDDTWGSLATSRLSSKLRNVCFLPSFYFDGFHPDTVYVETEGKRVQGPTGDYHSRICAASFSKGYSPNKTALLYNAFIFEKLGYFLKYNQATNFIVRRFLEFGLDITADLKRWESRGCFMHSFDHPKTFVIMDIIRQAASRFEICDVGSICEHEIVPDTFQLGPVMPVYPEIARRLGFEGSRLFRAETDYYARRFQPLDYATYAARCFKVYRTMPMESLALTDGFHEAHLAISSL